jgi:hypothetical protein
MVVWGWTFIDRAAEALDPQSHHMPVQIIEDDAHAALTWALALEGRAGGYGWRELSRLRELCEHLDITVDAELSRRISGDAGFVAKTTRFDALPSPVGDAVNAASIDLRTAEGLARHLSGDYGVLLEEVADLSFSKRRQVLRLALENVRRARRGAGSVGAGPAGAAGDPNAGETDAGETDAGDPNAGAVDAAELAREVRTAREEGDPVEALTRRRYPTLTSLQENFEAIRRELADDRRVELEAPPYFEGEEFRFHLRFRGVEDIDRGIRALEGTKQRMHELQDLL